jgi:hypothetical protein
VGELPWWNIKLIRNYQMKYNGTSVLIANDGKKFISKTLSTNVCTSNYIVPYY